MRDSCAAVAEEPLSVLDWELKLLLKLPDRMLWLVAAEGCSTAWRAERRTGEACGTSTAPRCAMSATARASAVSLMDARCASCCASWAAGVWLAASAACCALRRARPSSASRGA